MNISGFFKALQIMGTISSWSVKALEDGKVTLDEGTELVKDVCKILDIPLELNIDKETKLINEDPDLEDPTPKTVVDEQAKLEAESRDLKPDSAFSDTD